MSLARRLFRRPVRDAVAAELEFHRAMVEHDLIRGGVPPRDAARQAALRCATLPLIAAECEQIGEQMERTMHRTAWLHDFSDDIRFALRQLRKAPAFSMAAVLTLSLGIGATTVIFSAVDAVLLKRMAVSHPDQLAIVNERMMGSDGNVSAGNFVDWTSMSRSFTGLAAEGFESFNLSGTDTPERVLGGRATGSFFPTLGVAPIRGRVFGNDEDVPGRDKVVVLGEALWRSHFGADPSLVGRTITLDNAPYTVIGIMPASFDPTVSAEQLWIPAAFDAARRAQHDEHYLTVLGRLKPGITLPQAQAEMDIVGRTLHQRYPNDANGLHLVGLVDSIVADYRKPLLLLQGAVILVLLVACGNVANLQLARSSARAQEMTVRAAIGAGRSRIVRQLLTENAVLAIVAALISLALAKLGIAALRVNAPAGIPRLDQAGISWRVAAFALGAALFSAFASGLVPALRLSRRDLQSTLRQAGRRTEGASQDWVRTVLIGTEVALSLPLLIGAGLLIRSALNLRHVDPGFNMQNVVMGRVIIPDGEVSQRVAATEQIVTELSHRPGVVSAAVTSTAPMGPTGGSNGLLAEGKPVLQENLVQSQLRMVSSGYLATMQMRLKRGRWISDADIAGGPRVVVLSETAANRLFPGMDPIGKRISCCEPNVMKTVIGVVADIRSRGPAQQVDPEFYLPIAQAPAVAWGWINGMMSVTVRTRAADGAEGINAIRTGVHAVLPTAPVYRLTTMRDALASTLAVERFNTTLLVSLGLIGMLLAAIGIYSVVSYFVTLRTHEIGVRLALGATGGNVLALLAWQGVRPIVAGLIAGTALALWTGRALQGSLHGVAPNDATTFAAVTGVLVVAGLLATLIPARRAARLDPVIAMR